LLLLKGAQKAAQDVRKFHSAREKGTVRLLSLHTSLDFYRTHALRAFGTHSSKHSKKLSAKRERQAKGEAKKNTPPEIFWRHLL
jgi:hypothetical protein